MGSFNCRPVSMEEAGRYAISHIHLLITTIRSYIVHLLSTYGSGRIRRNCSPWITRSVGFASSLEAHRISLLYGKICSSGRTLTRLSLIDIHDYLYELNFRYCSIIRRIYFLTVGSVCIYVYHKYKRKD